MDNKKSLIDCVANPDNKLLGYRVLENGVQYRFRDRVLPKWVNQMAKTYNYTVIDNEPSSASGRLISLVYVNARHSHREPNS